MPEAVASPLGEALRLLRSRGLTPSGHRRGTRSFEGELPCKGGPIKVRLSITDWDFLTYPSIKVLDHLDVLPALSPHVYASGGVLFLHGLILYQFAAVCSTSCFFKGCGSAQSGADLSPSAMAARYACPHLPVVRPFNRANTTLGSKPFALDHSVTVTP